MYNFNYEYMTFLYDVHVYMFCSVVLYCIALPARDLFAIKIIYYFRERISLYSCDVIEGRPKLVISTSHGLLNLQATMPSAISRFVMLMLCQFPSLSVHDSAVRTKYLYLKFI